MGVGDMTAGLGPGGQRNDCSCDACRSVELGSAGRWTGLGGAAWFTLSELGSWGNESFELLDGWLTSVELGSGVNTSVGVVEGWLTWIELGSLFWTLPDCRRGWSVCGGRDSGVRGASKVVEG